VVGVAAENQDRRVDALDAFHGFRLVGIFSGYFDVVVLDLIVFSWGGGAGVYREEFVVGGSMQIPAAKSYSLEAFMIISPLWLTPMAAHGILVDVRNRLEVFDDGDEVFVVERRAGLEHAAVAADAVGKILGRLGAFIGVGNFVAIIHSDHHVAPGDQCGPAFVQALGKLFDFLHAFAAFPQPMVMAGNGPLPFRFADEDGDIDFIAGEDESVVAGDVRNP